MATDNDALHNHDDEHEVAEERQFSSVADNRRRNTAAIVLVGLAAILVIGYLLWSSYGGGGPSKIKKQTYHPASTLPTKSPATPNLPEPKSQQQTPSKVARFASQKEKQEELKHERARRHAPVLIVNKSGNASRTSAQSANTPDQLTKEQNQLQTQLYHLQNASSPIDQPPPYTSANSGVGAGDNGSAARSRAFARREASASVDQSYARQLSDLGDRIDQGKMIHGVLETAVNSDAPGQLRAIVSHAVYSANGQEKLILRGSRLIGAYRSGLVRGESRVFVVWNRLIEPNGVSVQIGSTGTNDLGVAGMGGIVDRHFLERFGNALLISVIGSGVQAAQNSGSPTIILNTSQAFDRVAEQALRATQNISPTVHVHQGKPIQVFVNRDLLFSNVSIPQS